MKRFVRMLFSAAAAAAVVLCSSSVFAQVEEANDETGFAIGQAGLAVVILLMVGVMVLGDVFYKKKKPSPEEASTAERDDEK